MRMPKQSQLQWKEQPLIELIRLAWPIAVSMLSFSLMTLADTLFVGRLGAAALAGVGLAGTTAFTVSCFSLGFLRTLKVLVSQDMGAEGERLAQRWLSIGLLWALLHSMLTLSIGVAIRPYLACLSDDAEMLAHALCYYDIRLYGAALFLVFNVFRACRYGKGDSRSPMIAALIGNTANIVLDWLFLVEFEWGVAGVAWATFAGAGLQLVYMIITEDAGSWSTFRRLCWRDFKEAARIGWGPGFQFIVEVGSFAFLTGLIARMGEIEMAAHQIAIQVIHFTFLPTVAVSEASSVMVGQAVGADQANLVRPVGHRALGAAFMYSMSCTILLVLFGPSIAGFFTDNPEVVASATGLLVLASVFQFFDGAQVVARGVLMGVGDIRFPALVGIGCAWLFTPPFAYFLGVHAGMGASGGWIGLCLEIIVSAGLFWWRLEREDWRTS